MPSTLTQSKHWTGHKMANEWQTTTTGTRYGIKKNRMEKKGKGKGKRD